MKKIILLVLATSFFTLANAQRYKGGDDALDKNVLEVTVKGPVMASLDLQKELNLSQEQYEQVMELNVKRYEELLSAEHAYKDDVVQLSKTIYSIHLEADKALSAMLNPKQLRVFIKLDSRQQAHYITDNSEE